MNTLAWRLQNPIGLFFGGAPTISGGMTKAETDAVLAEQRQYAEKADIARETRLAEYEKNRLASEESLIAAQKAAEQAKITSQQDSEKMLSDEGKAVDLSKLQASDKLSSNFYESIYKGIGSVPVGENQTSGMTSDQITAALKQYKTQAF